jgi:hypothetical protein
MGLRRSYALDAREVERAALPMCQRYHLVTAKIHPLPQNEGPLLAELGRSVSLAVCHDGKVTDSHDRPDSTQSGPS